MLIKRGHEVSVLLVDDEDYIIGRLGRILMQNGYIYEDKLKGGIPRQPTFGNNDSNILGVNVLKKGNVTILLVLGFDEGKEVIKERDDLVAVFLDGDLKHYPGGWSRDKIGGGDLLFLEAMKKDSIQTFFSISSSERLHSYMYRELTARGDNRRPLEVDKREELIADRINKIADQYNVLVGDPTPRSQEDRYEQ